MTATRSLPNVELGRLQNDEIAYAAGVAARGLRDNPDSIAAFGTDAHRRLRSLEPMFEWILTSMGDHFPLVARRDGVIVGIAAMALPDRCFLKRTAARETTIQLGRFRVRTAMPQVPRGLFLPLLGLGARGLARLQQWGEASIKHDPVQRHQHVELVVVEAGLQGLGIGRLMMEELCREMDKVGEMAYLETDRPENVRFYEHYGFQVVDEAPVLGNPNWYMERLPSSQCESGP